MIIHMDMDAFYAAVEQLDNPALRGLPLIVGGKSKRAVVSTASYEARRFGVRSAMPMFQALQLCPRAVVVPVRMGRYQEVSASVMAVLAEFSPLVEQVGIDEAYIDIGGLTGLFGDPPAIAGAIQTKIQTSLNLSCSMGVAPLKFLAKIASDMKKPGGLTLIPPDRMMDFIRELPIEKVPGVGPATLVRLKSLGIRTLGDVHGFNKRLLQETIGKFASRLMALAHGMDDSAVTPGRPVKSISAENTLDENTVDPEVLHRCLLQHAERVGRELRESGMLARTLTLKIKYGDFRQMTRSVTLENPTQSSGELYTEAVRLLADVKLAGSVRLIGLGASGLLSRSTPVQQELFGEGAGRKGKWEKLERTVDGIAAKYGNKVIQKASLTDSPPGKR